MRRKKKKVQKKSGSWERSALGPTPARSSASKETTARETGPFFLPKKLPVDLVRLKKFFRFSQAGRRKGTWEEQADS